MRIKQNSDCRKRAEQINKRKLSINQADRVEELFVRSSFLLLVFFCSCCSCDIRCYCLSRSIALDRSIFHSSKDKRSSHAQTLATTFDKSFFSCHKHMTDGLVQQTKDKKE